MSDLVLSEPVLKNWKTKSLPSLNDFYGDPYKLITGNKINFHFGAKNGEALNYAWFILTANQDLGAIDAKETVKKILSKYTKKQIVDNASYLQNYGFHYCYVVFNDDIDWESQDTEIQLVEFFLQSGVLISNTKRYTKLSFQQFLVDLYGVNLTNKPLVYATTKLEGYLSEICNASLEPKPTNISLFPGDVDVVLYTDTYETRNVIELKKRTSGSKCKFEDESFKNYSSNDAKKYGALAKLTKKLGKEHFYNIIYSTQKAEEKRIKIEKISNDLTLLSTYYRDFSEVSEVKALFDRFYI